MDNPESRVADQSATYIAGLAEQLCARHAALVVTAEDDLAVLRGLIAITARDSEGDGLDDHGNTSREDS